jgi:hypothetical protein
MPAPGVAGTAPDAASGKKPYTSDPEVMRQRRWVKSHKGDLGVAGSSKSDYVTNQKIILHDVYKVYNHGEGGFWYFKMLLTT